MQRLARAAKLAGQVLRCHSAVQVFVVKSARPLGCGFVQLGSLLFCHGSLHPGEKLFEPVHELWTVVVLVTLYGETLSA